MIYSFKDFTGGVLKDADDISDITIIGSCFSQESPDTHVFPDNMTGVSFVRCNLDNVFIPAGNSTEDCSQRRYMRIDGQNWLVDEDNNPVQVL